MQITLRNLPKVSLNKSYAGEHWSNRKKLKDIFSLIVRNQFKGFLSKENKYECNYTFVFKSNPLDATNCAFMAKLIEDIIFEDDKFDIITKVSFSSKKGTEDIVYIDINF